MSESHHDHTEKNLSISFILNFLFTFVEFWFGFTSGSLALISDAGHNLTDSLALFISFISEKLSHKRADTEKTYGYGRVTILAALLNACLLLFLAFFIMYQSIARINHPQSIQSVVVIVVSAIGLLINTASALVLLKDKDDLNIKSSFTCMVYDALASLGALIAGVGIYITHLSILDSFISIAIAMMLLFNAWGIVQEALHVLLEGVPQGLDVGKVRALILDQPLVKDVDDLHVWALSSRYSALSCHIITEETHLEEVIAAIHHIKQELKDAFAIEHATIEAELTRCLPKH